MGNEKERASFPAGPQVIIIAIGQEFRRDDAVGILAVRAWLDIFPNRKSDPDIKVEIVGLPGVNLLSSLEGYKTAILVDGVKSGMQPGTIRSIQVPDLEAFTSSSTNAHGWGAAETILLGLQLTPELMPGQISIIGIEVSDVNPGNGLSREVEESIPEAAAAIEAYVRSNLASKYG